MIEWRWGLPPLTPRDAHAVNLARTLQFHRSPDLTAPQWEVPAAATIDVKAAPDGPSEHEQEWMRVGDMAAGFGFDVG